jgi:hypothetical protein
MRTKRSQLILVALALSAVVLSAVACSTTNNKSGSGASSSPGSGTDASFGAPLDQTSGSIKESSALSADRAAQGSLNAADAPAGVPSIDPTFQSALDRKIVQTTTVDVGVKDVGRTFTDIISAAEVAGGFVAGSAFSNTDGKQVADLTIRVPADHYQDLLGKVRLMGNVSNETSDANDVTEEYTDLQARMRTLQATEQRYLVLLAKADNINDILTVQDRLDGVRGQIEQAQGRSDLLDHMTDLATITIHLRPIGAASSGGGGSSPIDSAQTAWQHSLDTLLGLATAGLVVVAFAWWLVPVAVVGLVATRWWTNRKSRTPASGAA